MSLMGIGWRKSKVISSVLSKAGSGTPQIVVSFEELETGDTIDAYLMMTDKAIPFSNDKLKRLGWDPAENDFQYAQLNEGTISPIVNAEIDILVKDEIYEGQPRRKVEYIGLGGGSTPMEQAEAVGFAEDLRRRAMLSRGPQSNSAPNRSARTQAKKNEVPDDDVPF